jgi:hypothetical protein
MGSILGRLFLREQVSLRDFVSLQSCKAKNEAFALQSRSIQRLNVG